MLADAVVSHGELLMRWRPIGIDTAILQANGDATSLQQQYVPLRTSIEIDLFPIAAVAVSTVSQKHWWPPVGLTISCRPLNSSCIAFHDEL